MGATKNKILDGLRTSMGSIAKRMTFSIFCIPLIPLDEPSKLFASLDTRASGLGIEGTATYSTLPLLRLQ